MSHGGASDPSSLEEFVPCSAEDIERIVKAEEREDCMVVDDGTMYWAPLPEYLATLPVRFQS